jgi:4-hydroxymandelate oxidase
VVAQAATGPLWFQSYGFTDRGLTLEMAHRAEAAGYAARCLTLDAKVKPKRERNLRHHDTGPASPNYAQVPVPGSPWSFGLDGPTGTNALRDPASTWADLDWLAAHTRLPLVVKGIMVGEDGRQAAEHGAQGVIVSNHGARYLDTTLATIEALPEVVEAVAGQAEV